MKIINKLSKIFLLGLLITAPAQGMDFIKNHPWFTITATIAFAAYAHFTGNELKKGESKVQQPENEAQKPKNELQWIEKKLLNAQLNDAVLDGDLEKTKEFVNKGADIKYIHVFNDNHTCSLLYGATLSGNLSLLKYLIEEHNLDMETVHISTDGDISSALKIILVFHYNWIGGLNEKIMKYLIDKGANLECVLIDTHSQKYPALWCAITHNHSLETIKYLVEYGAKLNTTFPHDNNGVIVQETPYNLATRLGHHNIATYLKNAKDYFDNGTQVVITQQNKETIPNYFALAILKEDLANIKQTFFEQARINNCLPYLRHYIELADRLNKQQSKYELIQLNLDLGNQARTEQESEILIQLKLKNKCKQLWDMNFKFN